MDYIVTHYGLGTRRACALVKQTRSTHYYRSIKDRRLDLRGRMRELARTRIRYGYRRIYVLLVAVRAGSWAATRPFAFIRKSNCNCDRKCRVDARWWQRGGNASRPSR